MTVKQPERCPGSAQFSHQFHDLGHEGSHPVIQDDRVRPSVDGIRCPLMCGPSLEIRVRTAMAQSNPVPAQRQGCMDRPDPVAPDMASTLEKDGRLPEDPWHRSGTAHLLAPGSEVCCHGRVHQGVQVGQSRRIPEHHAGERRPVQFSGIRQDRPSEPRHHLIEQGGIPPIQGPRRGIRIVHGMTERPEHPGHNGLARSHATGQTDHPGQGHGREGVNCR